jgi:hypothetical protein
MSLFTQMTMDGHNKTDSLIGYKVNFSEGQMSGMLSSSFKATAVYKKQINELISCSFTGQNDFGKPGQKSVFGVTMSLGGM